MRRREFLALSSVAALGSLRPLSAFGQQTIRRIAVVSIGDPDQPRVRENIAVFLKRMAELGWIEGINLAVEYRYSGGNADLVRTHAAELVVLSPDLILVQGTPAATAFKRATSTIPIVFTTVADPVSAGLVESMARPGGNVTGFSTFELDIGGKWLELLREVQPNLQRVGGIVDPAFPAFAKLWKATQDAAPRMGLETTTISFHDRSDDLETAVASFAAKGNGALISLPTAINNVEGRRLVELSERHRLPLVHPFMNYLPNGGLLAYGLNSNSSFVVSAGYVDRILKGTKPSDLPVQGPVKYELGINLKTAKALGLTIPPLVLARADELIE